MELHQLTSWTSTSSGCLSSPPNLKNCARTSISRTGLGAQKIRQLVTVPLAKVSAEGEAATNGKSRGWFYKTFVADQTMEAKLNKLKGDMKARNGYVGSWFQDSFKYTAWIEVHRKLTERSLKDVDCAEANSRIKSGKAIFLDCREAQDYERCHAKGAYSAPLFRLIQGNDTKSNLRRLGYALLTDFAGTERNPEFVTKAVEAVGGERNKKKQVIMYCSVGGTLQTYVERKGPKAKKFNDPERMFGRQSRSLKGIYELQEAGFTNVVHLKGGLNDWMHFDYPVEGGGS